MKNVELIYSGYILCMFVGVCLRDRNLQAERQRRLLQMLAHACETRRFLTS